MLRRTKVRAKRATWEGEKKRSYEGPREASPGGACGMPPPGKKAHMRARAKRTRGVWASQGVWGNTAQDSSILLPLVL
jgi:hypothetical protein